MGVVIFHLPTLVQPVINRTDVHKFGRIELASPNVQFCRHQRSGARFPKLCRNSSYSSSQSVGDEDPENSIQELRVPSHWLEPSRATEEAEWLRVTLHKWLDDEYCPEPTNVEISKVAANSFYKSLVERRADLGEILLKMAVELESISYQESFHGAFSSANAAVNLILQRILRE
ncbi:hypothetical protein CDL12_28533 [Handroanthus impetiginosus]|uniref:Uncharacterized protein n=1 Tax=Handroanthus impetiginosus TaxID=429701 RepID=A0A2G9G252_9LAMI|nr:hypothetical protein CDL12_28533 [Handroanthus impetiginosus]